MNILIIPAGLVQALMVDLTQMFIIAWKQTQHRRALKIWTSEHPD